MPALTIPSTGKGTLLGYSTASGAGPYTYINVAELVDLKPKITVGEAEVKLLSNSFKGYLPTVTDATMDFTVQYAPGDTAMLALQGAILAGTVLHWQILFSDAVSEITFDGFLKDMSFGIENEKTMDATLTIRFRTAPVFGTVS